MRLTIYFDEPFWVGVFERDEGGVVRAARVVFGREPSDAEVYAWIRERWSSLAFGGDQSVDARRGIEHANPKRRQREAARAMGVRGASTKAQMALQAQREENKQRSRAQGRERREAEEERRFQRRRDRRRERHNGH